MITFFVEDRNGHSVAEYSFGEGTYKIGRIEGNDIVLHSGSVSRNHAQIIIEGEKCYIEDLNSSNGVLINDDLTPVKGRIEFTRGMYVWIGDFSISLGKSQSGSDDDSPESGMLKTQIVSGEQSGYKIVRVGDGFAGEEFMLSEVSNTIGRTEDNYILLSDNSISRNHAKIININMVYKVVDLGSSNGTFVNNKKLQGEQVLRSGDLLRFGNLSFVFVPATQIVNLSQYQGKSASKLPVIIACFAGILVIAIVVVWVVASRMDKENQERAEQENMLIQDAQAQVDATFKRIDNLIAENRYKDADNLIATLIEDNPDNAEISKRKEIIDKERFNEDLYNTALSSAMDSNDVSELNTAVEQLKKIHEESVFYPKALEEIQRIERRVVMSLYHAARSACDTEATSECVTEICDAVKKLDPVTDKKIIDETITYMENLAKHSSGYKKAAKNCLSELKTDNN